MAITLGEITNEIHDKILSPAKSDAERIVREARERADQIMAEALGAAARIHDDAQREADATKKQLETDLNRAARNFLLMLEEKLETAVVEPIIDEEVKAVMSNPAFLEKMIETLMVEFGRHQGREQTFEILLPKRDRQELEAWFLKKFRDKAAGALVVRFTDKITFGFQFGLAGSGAHFNFSNGLIEVFADFCSPRFRKHFFTDQPV